MTTIGSLTRYVQDLNSPDDRLRDQAARMIWERFSPRLKLLVRRHLDSRILRREDEQDILQSMFFSFCAGQSAGRAAPASRHELWKLLVRITMCKVVNTAHRHMAGRRDVRRERTDRGKESGEVEFPQWMLHHVDRSQPRPEEQAAVVEEVQRLLGVLKDDRLRQIVVWKLEGYTNAEIAQLIGMTVRSVELKLQLIRALLEDEVRDSPPRRWPRYQDRPPPEPVEGPATPQDRAAHSEI